MSNRDYILAPKALEIEIALEPAYAMLDSLMMMNAVDEYLGMSDWLRETAAALPESLKHDNKIVMDGLYGAFTGDDTSWPSFLACVDYLERLDPFLLRDRVINHMCAWNEKKRIAHPEIVPPTPDIFLSDLGTYINYMGKIYADKEQELELNELKELHHLYNNPAQLQDRLVNHLRHMWERVLKDEWERVQPRLRESVEALQNIDYSGLSGLEATRIITGRDMSNSPMAELLDEAERLVFIPVPHIGPYVGLLHGETCLRVLFRPRIPEGARVKSPDLDRSELLVRMNALADDTRLRVLELFTTHQELCAQDIIQLLDLSQSAASRHLRQLTATGYLTERRREGAKCYSLNTSRVESTITALRCFLLGK